MLESLKQFPPEDLAGLEVIWLHNNLPAAANPDDWGVHHEGARIFGAYFARTKKYSSYVVLFVKNIYCSLIPHFPFYNLTAVPVLCLSKTLAHEIAHHLFATRGYIFTPREKRGDEEKLCEEYAERHLQRLQKKWRYKIGFRLLNWLAELHYSTGIVYSSKKKYCEAADHWYLAWNLNPKLENVRPRFHLAMEECKKTKTANIERPG